MKIAKLLPGPIRGELLFQRCQFDPQIPRRGMGEEGGSWGKGSQVVPRVDHILAGAMGLGGYRAWTEEDAERFEKSRYGEDKET